MSKGIIYEYIWIDGYGELRSKTKVIKNSEGLNNKFEPPEWNYDGSSTGQAENNGQNTEIILKPCFICNNPLKNVIDYKSLLVLCDTYNIDGKPTNSNSRILAKNIFDQKLNEEPWYGLEQEYYMFKNEWAFNPDRDGLHYCGIYNNGIQRKIVDEHLEACLQADLNISGINAEVGPQQWEFQVGPCVGIEAADQLYIARYLLQKISEKYDVIISYEPKINPNLSGSGCHINFSTFNSRNDTSDKEILGYNYIMEYIFKMSDKSKHLEHLNVYGMNNDLRLTGKHETAKYNDFTYGIGTRNTSIRIPFQTFNDKKGYLEDRRPAANLDPYKATSVIFKNCCL